MKRQWLSVAVHAALAGQLTAAGLAAQAQQGALEEIVVTATRRETNLQDVPISVIAITGDDLEMRGMDSVESLSATVPNLNIIGGLAGPGHDVVHGARDPARRHLHRWDLASWERRPAHSAIGRTRAR